MLVQIVGLSVVLVATLIILFACIGENINLKMEVDKLKIKNDSLLLLSCDDEFEYAGTNPCAEEPLPAGGSCLLGSINLAEFACDTGFDFESFKHCVKSSVIALNEVLDEGLPLHPLKEQRESVYDWRQIGLGIFGLADLLIKLGIKYGSPEAIDLCDMIGHTMLNYCELTQEECFCVKTKEHPCYYINDDYTFKEDIPFFGFKKGTDSKEVFKWQNI